MAATQGSMADVASSNSTYLSSAVDEPELNSINFRQSLRFFQEQLINSNGFPSPSCSSSDIQKICIGFSSDHHRSEIQFNDVPKSLTNSRISIPTVDTILESVRVLRAIQKSQQQRGSSWSINLVKSDDDHEIQQSTIFEDWKNVDQGDILKADSERDAILPLAIDKTLDNEVDKPKQNNLIGKESNVNEFWPNNNVISEKITTIINENAIVASELQLNVNFQPPVQKSFVDSEFLLTKSEENTGSDLEGKLCAYDIDKNKRSDTFESVLTDACDNNSGEGKGFQIASERNILDQNCNTKFPAKVTETPNQQIKCDSTDTETVEICQTNLKENKNESAIDKNENSFFENISENCAMENQSPRNKELTLKTIELGCEEMHHASSLSPNSCKQFRPESRSDTCSSIYVSAEGSPCPSLYNDLDALPQVHEEIEAYSSQCVNNESKESTLDTWITESSGIGSDLTNDSTTNTSFRSSTPIDNMLDEFLSSEKLNKNEISSQNSFQDIPKTIESFIDTIPNSSSNEIPVNSNLENSIENNKLDTFPISTLDEIPANNNLENCIEDNKKLNTVPYSTINEVPADSYLENCIEDNEKNKLDQCLDKNQNNMNDKEINEDHTKITSGIQRILEPKESDELIETHGAKKFTTSSWNLEAITESLYTLTQPVPLKVFPEDPIFHGSVYVMSQGSFCNHPEGKYILDLQDHTLQILKETNILMAIPLTYAKVCVKENYMLEIDNRLGKCLYFKSETKKELMELKKELELHCSQNWKSERLNLVHYPLKGHKNVVIIDLGSCSTRAGILMDQPTLPFLFFPSICAVNKKTGNQVYGKEALQLEVRQNSNLSFPLRPSIKIVKHNIDIDLIGGLFKKIFQDLRVNPLEYTVQVSLPRSLSIHAQDALVKLLLEDIKVQSVSLTHQALLTLYAHNVSTGIVVDIGDRMDILPVVDGFIVDGGVTRLPHGGQRLIHHMKHALAEKHISLSNDIDSFVVQYIAENLTYVAEDYDAELNIATHYPDLVKKTISLEDFARDEKYAQLATLDEARFKMPEGLFKPELWGLDNPGVHKLVQKAIQATGVDVRKIVAENIYISGGVTLIPGFIERLLKEVSNLNKPRIVPKVIASNYRYHCTYIGACELARMEVFSKMCVSLEEYSKNQKSSLNKFLLCF